MNARVLPLVLVTALFMAAWNGDQAAMEAAIARRTARVVDEAVAGVPATHHQVSLATSTLREPASQLTDARGETVPLPLTIAEGIYCAISQSGKMQQLVIGPSQARSESSRDFHIVDSEDGVRWYLVRVTNNDSVR